MCTCFGIMRVYMTFAGLGDKTESSTSEASTLSFPSWATALPSEWHT